MSLGLEWAGFECAAAVDNNRTFLETFATNRDSDDAVVQADLGDQNRVSEVLAHIRERCGNSRLALLVGGPPCQGFSTAGSNIKDDPRNGLVWSFLRFVEQLLPTMVIMENVPALAWKSSGKIIHSLEQQLTKLGYATSHFVAHAEGYGVPQLRRRLFLFGWRGLPTIELLHPPFAILEPSFRDAQGKVAALGKASPFTVADAIGDLPGEPAAGPDIPVDYAKSPQSNYARWLRGEMPLEMLLGSSGEQKYGAIRQLALPM
jgi:DNA (cytosine-5)-methyltransferase 1